MVITNFLNQLASGVPSIIGAILILIVGWFVAKILRSLVVQLLDSISWDKNLEMDGNETNSMIGDLFYYLVMVIVFLIALDGLGLSNVLTPLENMLSQFLLFIPNLVAAALIGLIGYMLAKFISNLVELGGSFLDKLAQKAGYEDTNKIIDVLKTVVFIMVFVPILIQAIDALKLESLSVPLNDILYGFIGIIGNVIVAAVILFIFIWVGNLLRGFLSDLLQKLGLDGMTEKMQLQYIVGQEQSISKIFAGVLYAFVVFFGVVTAAEVLELQTLSEILFEVLNISGSIAFGLGILIVGNFVSVLIYKAMNKSEHNAFIASVVRYAILGLFLAISLRAMGIANEIVELAFGLTLGTVAVVIALSYGLGGRDAAGDHFREIIKQFKDGDDNSSGSSNPSITE